MLKLIDVSKKYPNGVHALNNINITIQDGEFVYVIGSTGSGKSTLIKLINSEEVPTKGEVWVRDTNVGQLSHRAVPRYRRTIGVVFSRL